MAEPASGARATRSYLSAALADPINRTAFGVALLAALAVGALSRAPLSQPFSLELRGLSAYQARRELTLQGFELPCAQACTTTRARPRLVFHRPLPADFELELELREAAPPRDRTAEGAALLFGPERFALDPGPEPATLRLRLANPEQRRSLELRLPPGQKLAFSRVAVRSAPSS